MAQTKIINVDTSKAQQSIKELESQVKNLNKDLQNTQKEIQSLKDVPKTTNTAFKGLQSSVENTKLNITELNKAVNTAKFNIGDFGASISKIGAGVAGGFNIVSGAIKFMGLESDETSKAISELQFYLQQIPLNLFAISEGITAFRNGFDLLSKSIANFTLDLKADDFFKKIFFSTKDNDFLLKGILFDPSTIVESLFSGIEGDVDVIDTFRYQLALLKEEYENNIEYASKATKYTQQFINEMFEGSSAADKFIIIMNRLTGAWKQLLLGLAKGTGIGAVIAAFGTLFAGTKIGIEKTEKQYLESLKKIREEQDKALEEQRKQIEFNIGLAEKVFEVQFGGDKVKVYEALVDSFTKKVEDVAKRLQDLGGGDPELQTRMAQLQAEFSILEVGSEEYYQKLLEITDLQYEIDQQPRILADGINVNATQVEELNSDLEFWNKKLIEARQKLLEANIVAGAMAKNTKSTSDNLKRTVEHLEKLKPAQYDYSNIVNNLLGEEQLSNVAAREAGYVAEEFMQKFQDILNLEGGLTVTINTTVGNFPENERLRQFVDYITEAQRQLSVLNDTMGRFGESSLGLGSDYANVVQDFSTMFSQMSDIIMKDGEVAFSSYTQMASSGIQAVGSLLNALSNEQDTSSKEGFEAQKKYQISATVMNTLAGVINAWSSALAITPPVGPILGGINSAMIASLGAVQIAKIAKQRFGETSSVSQSSINTTLIPPTQYTQAVQGANIEQKLGDNRVYVTETDISNVQNRVRVQESENTY